MRHAPRAWRQCSSWVLTRVAPGQRRQGSMCTPRLQRKHCTKLPMQLLPSGCSPELALASATRIFWAASQFSSLPAHVFRVVACRCEPRRTASSQSRARKHLSYPLCLPMSSGWWPAIAAAARMGVGWPSTAGRHLEVRLPSLPAHTLHLRGAAARSATAGEAPALLAGTPHLQRAAVGEGEGPRGVGARLLQRLQVQRALLLAHAACGRRAQEGKAVGHNAEARAAGGVCSPLRSGMPPCNK